MFWEAYDTSHDLYPEAEPDDDHFNRVNSNKAVDELMEPSQFEIRAFNYAVQAHSDFQHYGLPYEGGVKDQPWVWHLALTCMRDALSIASSEARADARAEASDDADAKRRAQLRAQARVEARHVRHD